MVAFVFGRRLGLALVRHGTYRRVSDSASSTALTTIGERFLRDHAFHVWGELAYYAGRIAGGIVILGGGAFAWLRLHDEGRTVARNVAAPLKDFTYATIGMRDAQGRIAQALAAIACVAYMALMTQFLKYLSGEWPLVVRASATGLAAIATAFATHFVCVALFRSNC